MQSSSEKEEEEDRDDPPPPYILPEMMPPPYEDYNLDFIVNTIVDLARHVGVLSRRVDVLEAEGRHE